jgi:hypothetical protein
VADAAPIVTWIGAEHASTFELQIDRIPTDGPATTVATFTDIPRGDFGHVAFLVSQPLVEGNYQFRVRALNALNEAGPWSSSLAFTIDLGNLPPLPPRILAVPSRDSLTTLNFAWTPESYATSYEIRIQNGIDEGAATVLQRDQLGATILSLPHQFTAGQYRVQVRSLNRLGASVWSDPVTFELDHSAGNLPPTSIQLSSAVVKERLAGLVIGTLSANDPDAGQTHTFTTDDTRFEMSGSNFKLKDGQYLEISAGQTVEVAIRATDSGSPPQSLTQTVVIQVSANAAPWRNEQLPADTNGDGRVVPLDALRVINQLNVPTILESGGRLPTARPANGSAFYDVNGDGFCTSNDVLRVVNFLNTQTGEGELESYGGEEIPLGTVLFMLPAATCEVPLEACGNPAGSAESIPPRSERRVSPAVTNLDCSQVRWPTEFDADLLDELESLLDILVADWCSVPGDRTGENEGNKE